VPRIVTLAPPPPPTADPAVPPAGRVSKATPSTVEGEAWDPAAPDTVALVELHGADGAFRGFESAGLADVDGITRPGHGFRITTPAGLTGNPGDRIKVLIFRQGAYNPDASRGVVEATLREEPR
jgi:hypothetical protein